jgi:hypothetical protein
MLEVVQYYVDDPRARIDARERLGRAARRIRWTLWTCRLHLMLAPYACPLWWPRHETAPRHGFDTCQAAVSHALHVALVLGTAQCMPVFHHQQKARKHGTFTSELTETACALCRSVASRTDAKPPKSDKEKAKEKERRAKARAEAAKAAEEAAKVPASHPTLCMPVNLRGVQHATRSALCQQRGGAAEQGVLRPIVRLCTPGLPVPRSGCAWVRPFLALTSCSVARRRCPRRSQKPQTSTPRWRQLVCSRPWRTVRLLPLKGLGVLSLNLGRFL